MKKWASGLFDFIISIPTLGVKGSYKDSGNRVTLFTNLMAIWGLFLIVPLSHFLVSAGIPLSLFAPTFSIPVIGSLLVLYLNRKEQYLLARLGAVVTINACGWQAAFLFGKTFNGYWMFFIAITYSIVALGDEKLRYRIPSFLMSFIPLPALDFLAKSNRIPITGLDSKNFDVSVLLVDAILIPGFLTIIMLVEKNYALKYEKELKELNSDLENKVQIRTASLLKTKEENIQAAIVKSQFFSNISHELRTPIQAIMGYAELGNRHLHKSSKNVNKELFEKLSNDLSKISQGSHRLLGLLNNLLEITHYEENKFTPTSKDFDLWAMMDSTLKNFDFDGRALSVEIQRIEGIHVNSDETLIRNATQCLLENAVKYSDPLSVITVRSIRKKGFAEVYIINQGKGIPQNEEKQIFEAFFQGSRTDNRTGGTGLGLTLCQKYLSAINGQVQLEDPSPESTTFKLAFPIHLEKIKTAA